MRSSFSRNRNRDPTQRNARSLRTTYQQRMSLFAHDGIPLLLLVIVSKPKHLSRDEGKERNAKDCFFIIIIIAFPFFFQVRKKRNQGCNWYGFRWDVPKKNRDRKERADMGCILFDTFGVVGDLRLETPSIRSIRWGALGCGSEPGCICGFVWRGGSSFGFRQGMESAGIETTHERTTYRTEPLVLRS